MPFAHKFGGFLSSIGKRLSPDDEMPFRALLEEHFKGKASSFPVVTEGLQGPDLPNLHLALESYLKAPDRSFKAYGVPYDAYREVSLTQLVTPSKYADGTTPGPVSYLTVTLANDVTMACVRTAIFLVNDGGYPLAIYQTSSGRSYQSPLTVEVMARDRQRAEAVLSELRNSIRQNNVYRGNMVSLDVENRQLVVRFHRLPSIARDQVILPEEVLARIDRQAFAFSRHRDALLRAGRHLKRGMLLHGPPGTGKTFTAMYLASQMRERTTLLLTGRQQGLIQPCCAMARLLQPSTVVLEDVDLIAEDRRTNQSCAPLLFDLLNEMDGLRSDADVLFVLTTNRPEILEPALAARPGRVDMAIEIPLPDADCRRRLIASYASGLPLRLSEPERLIERTEGVSAAFIKELLRHTALVAADQGSSDEITDAHIDEALRELLADRDRLTRSLLGATQARPVSG